MTLKPEDRDVLVRLGRRFLWMAMAVYAAMSIGFWLAHALAPQAIGPVADYTVEVSLIGGLTFGGLYAAASILLPGRPKAASPATDR